MTPALATLATLSAAVFSLAAGFQDPTLAVIAAAGALIALAARCLA